MAQGQKMHNCLDLFEWKQQNSGSLNSQLMQSNKQRPESSLNDKTLLSIKKGFSFIYKKITGTHHS
jgi:hypothetical protein